MFELRLALVLVLCAPFGLLHADLCDPGTQVVQLPVRGVVEAEFARQDGSDRERDP